jgi:hypothetical protein
MDVLWVAIGTLAIAFLVILATLRFHRQIGAASSPETLKNTVEVMKLYGLFVVAAVSFYFVDYQKQRDEREKFDFDIFKAFAESARAGSAEARLATSKTMQAYRKTYVKANSSLDTLLVALDSTVLEDPEVRTLLSLRENQPLLTAIGSDRSPVVADAARRIERAPYAALIEQLYSAEPRLRGRAYNELVDRFAGAAGLVESLITYAQTNMDNENGIYNTVVVLSHLRADVTTPHRQQISAFCAQASTIGEKTATRCKVLLSRVDR